MDLPALIDPVPAVCRDAAAEILPIYDAHRAGQDAGVETKADRSPLTAADRASHTAIATGLAQRFPDIPLVSEEGEVRALGDARHWLVDPLDGTKEFLKANAEFTANGALVGEMRAVFCPSMIALQRPISAAEGNRART